MKIARGFTLIELMIVVLILSILSTMALPTYHDRVILAQLQEALALSDIAKQAVEKQFKKFGRFPVDNQAAGIPMPQRLIGNYVTGVTVSKGAIHVHLGNRINAHVEGRVISIRPATVIDSVESPISWLCGNAEPINGMQGAGENRTTLPENLLPIECRSWKSG